MTWDKCKSNPLNKVKFFKESPPKERILSHEDEKTLPDSSPNHIRPILITALNTEWDTESVLTLNGMMLTLILITFMWKQAKPGRIGKYLLIKPLETLLDLHLQKFVSKSVSGNSLVIEQTNDYEVLTEVRTCLEGAVPVRACGFDSRLWHHKQPFFFTLQGEAREQLKTNVVEACCIR